MIVNQHNCIKWPKNLSLNSYGICGVCEEVISIGEIVSYFEESNDLRGKPKLFFIDACRADNNGDYEKHPFLPESPDILIEYSTIVGKESYRDIYRGSWFIQTLIKQLHTHGHNAHLVDIMIVVNKEIAESELQGRRQMPEQVSTLTKFVYFKMATVEEILQARNAILTS